MSTMAQFSSNNQRFTLMQGANGRKYAVIARQVDGLRTVVRRMNSAKKAVLDQKTQEKLAKLR